MTVNKRYELLDGKYGKYFYDTSMKLDLTLKMILSKLNWLEKVRERNNFLINEINNLKRKITLLKEIKDD